MLIKDNISSSFYQSTIYSPISVKGIGLHTGEVSQVNLLPEKENTGIYFVRKDLSNSSIAAKTDFVIDTNFSTTLGFSSRHSIKTIEHLMASIIMLGISNLRIEVYGPEIPIMDGSAYNWIEMLKKSRLKSQTSPLTLYTLVRPICINIEDSFILAFPAPRFSISYGINFSQTTIIGNQWFHSNTEDINTFKNLLSSARTFGLLKNVKQLKQIGLIQGANLRNALVCTQTGWINGPLRFENEPVKHKTLDIIGDLALLGSLPAIKILAYKSSHNLHIELAKTIKNIVY
uniref:UDP-3-O-acyl-N-acetylglucosamine deacetylase n=1 Tax=Sciadococcus taiwanensis TaxID=3028030 RepID=A0A9Y1MXG6_9RHOD|nr:UDP-3-0-acyl N-acetylglucosamine deacetylase [Sciadococcus taiwanensis]